MKILKHFTSPFYEFYSDGHQKIFLNLWNKKFLMEIYRNI